MAVGSLRQVYYYQKWLLCKIFTYKVKVEQLSLTLVTLSIYQNEELIKTIVVSQITKQ